MRFKDRRPSGDYWSRVSLMASVLFIILVTFVLWGRYPKNEQPVVQKPKQAIRMKIPVGRAVFVGDKTGIEHEEKKITAIKDADFDKKPPDVLQDEKKPEKEKPVKAIDGYYRIRKGDSLFKVAGRKDVYGNSMKWPSLFRLNMVGLSGMRLSEDFEHKELPAGLGLRFVTPDEAAENLTKLGNKAWVVNVLSSQTSKKIVPAALKLMKNGYLVYISSAVVKGQEWMRLRVGYFGDRSEASAAGKKIVSLLEADGAWIARLGEQELKEFGGY
jgi:hypothetical protein